MSGFRLLVRVLAALLCLAALGVSVLIAVGFREDGTLALLGRIERIEPRLDLDLESGTLFDAHFRHIAWRDGDIRVRLDDVAWSLAWECLFYGAICADSLEVAALDVDVGEPSNAAKAPRPRLFMPLPLRLRDARLGSLRVHRGDIALVDFSGLEAVGTLRGSRIRIERLAAANGDYRIRLAGRLGTRGRWGVRAGGAIASGGRDVARFTLGGSLARLRVEAAFEQPAPFDLKGTVALLAPAIRGDLEARLRAPAPPLGDDRTRVTLTGGSVRLGGTLDALTADVDATLDSALLGESRLQAALTLGGRRLVLGSLELTGTSGTLAATGSGGIDPGTPWELALSARDFCPAGLAPQLRCALSGPVKLGGSYDLAAPLTRIDAELAGTLHERPATLAGSAGREPDGSWRIEGAEIASGAARIGARGLAGETLALDLEVDVPDIAFAIAGAGGSVAGSLQVAGTRSDPAVAGRLALRGFSSPGVRIDAAELVLDWLGSERANSVALDIGTAELAGARLSGASAWLRGSTAAHRFGARVVAGSGVVELGCSGEAAPAGDWNGRCAELRIARGDGSQAWRASKQMTMHWDAARAQLGIDPLCLLHEQASLCSNAPVRITRAGIDGLRLAAAELPFEWLEPWLPEGSRANGRFAFGIEADTGAQGPRIRARLQATQLELRLLAAGDMLPLALPSLEATLGADRAAATLGWDIAIGREGRSRADIRVRREDGSEALGGSITVGGVDAGPLLSMIPGVLAASGTLGGELRPGGTLGAPTLAGELAIAHGSLRHERLAEPVEDWSLAVGFDGPDATLAGDFHLHAGGSATLRGNARWLEHSWSAALQLAGSGIRIEPLQGSTATIAPELRLELAPHAARIEGSVAIPQADFRLDRLPANAVSVSPDQLVVGEAIDEAPFDYTAAIELRLGDAVRLRGYGAEGRLAGTVALRHAAASGWTADGSIAIEDGRYNAYGQRLDVTEGSLRFRGPLAEPALRITALRRIEDEKVQVGVRVSGQANDPLVSVYSRPPMAENRALHYLLTGRAPEAGANTDFVVSGAAIKLGLAGANRVTGKLMSKLGVQDFQVDTRQLGDGTEVQLSGYLSPDLYVRYGVSTFDNINTFRVRYRLRKSLFIEALSGAVSAIDLLYAFER